MNIRTILALAAVAASSSALRADEAETPEVLVPSVSNVRLSQASDRTVTVKYDLTNGPAVVIMDVMTNRGDNVWVSIGDANITGGELASCPQGAVNRKVETGDDLTITWRADLAWPNHKIPAGNVRVKLTTYPLDNPPDYMVVSLAAAADPRLRFYPSEKAVPGGVLANEAYRKTELLMRKIHAKGVTWTMGSFFESGRSSSPIEDAHQVVLSNDYYMGVFELTQAQWAAVAGSKTFTFSVQGLMRPADGISYVKARGEGYPNAPVNDSYMDKLRDLTGGTVDFDLPGEAQWEYACRSGRGEGLLNDGSYYASVAWNTFPGRHRNSFGASDDGRQRAVATAAPDEGGTNICGSYAPNAWGLYDMHGNIYEWCLDRKVNDITNKGGAIQTADSGEYVIRGGSYNNEMMYCRSASRNNSASGSGASAYLGFRVCAPASIR